MCGEKDDKNEKASCEIIKSKQTQLGYGGRLARSMCIYSVLLLPCAGVVEYLESTGRPTYTRIRVERGDAARVSAKSSIGSPSLFALCQRTVRFIVLQLVPPVPRDFERPCDLIMSVTRSVCHPNYRAASNLPHTTETSNGSFTHFCAPVRTHSHTPLKIENRLYLEFQDVSLLLMCDRNYIRS